MSKSAASNQSRSSIQQFPSPGSGNRQQQNAADLDAVQANELRPDEMKGQKDDSASFEIRKPGECSGLAK